MLALSRDSEQSFAESTGELNVIPVSISYEYDPCDSDKACELYAQQNGMTYTKDPFEDLDSIQKGFVGYKGRIQVTFGEPVADKYETADLLAAEIDRQIHLNYQLFPSNIIAWQMHSESVDTSILDDLENQWPDEDWTLAKHQFETRINSMPQDHQPIAIAAYAAPVDSQLHYSAQSQRL